MYMQLSWLSFPIKKNVPTLKTSEFLVLRISEIGINQLIRGEIIFYKIKISLLDIYKACIVCQKFCPQPIVLLFSHLFVSCSTMFFLPFLCVLLSLIFTGEVGCVMGVNLSNYWLRNHG